MERTEGVDVLECERCPALVDSRSRIVNGTGPIDADVALVGEGPGAQEDQEGEPFVGRSGSVLDDTLLEVGLERSAVRIVNCVRCRPPENRDPSADELANCRGYLEAELDAVDPEVTVALGKVPSEHLLDRSIAVTKEAGDVADARIADTPRRVVISVHPAATLYDSSQAETFERALRKAAELAGVDGSNGGGQARLGEF
jgi:DNA polymerase